jgi:tripartite-type tricarboxylate transporter receptor subunit TctC
MVHPARRAVLAAAAALPFAPRPARAQDWAPREPVKLINPFAPGGSPDILARVMAPHGPSRAPRRTG